MKTIEDVRTALYHAYKLYKRLNDGLEGKANEAFCQVDYPNIWDCDSLEQFNEPCKLMIYSYTLGPSRTHFFIKSNEEEQVDYKTWKTKDIFGKAVEVINEWVEQCKRDFYE